MQKDIAQLLLNAFTVDANKDIAWFMLQHKSNTLKNNAVNN